ncbi:MAG: MutH/Sau3AI family endonuclease [Gammaproteobacteria bacterium]
MRSLLNTPNSRQALLSRAQNLAGLSLWDFLQIHGQSLSISINTTRSLSLENPKNLLHLKGKIGQFLEQYLGADAGNQSKPDFVNLGVELKTIPVGFLNQKIQILESTYISVLPSLQEILLETWETAKLKQKIQCILWLPLEGSSKIPWPDRKIGQAFLWSPSPEQEKRLNQDWLEITNHIALGDFQNLNAYLGQSLQLRPKAANAAALKKQAIVNQDGELQFLQPKGFYFRSSFTQEILDGHFN